MATGKDMEIATVDGSKFERIAFQSSMEPGPSDSDIPPASTGDGGNGQTIRLEAWDKGTRRPKSNNQKGSWPSILTRWAIGRTMRKTIFTSTTGVKGVIRDRHDNRGNVYVDWAEPKYSADKELASDRSRDNKA